MAVYKEEKTNTWRAVYRYTDWNGERKQTQKRGFKTKREAQAWEREQLNKTSADLDMTFKSFVDLYTADMKTRLKENTWATKDHIIRTKLLPYFGRLKMCNITAQQIITWQNEMLNHKDENGKPYSPVYLKTVHNQLSAIFNHAVRYYNLRENPCKKAGSMGKKKNREMMFWTKEQYLKFAEVMMDKPLSFYAFEMLYWCGIREGELLALTPADFDFEKRTVSINKSYQRLNGQDLITTPKTEKSNRVITMPQFLTEEIQDYIKMLYGIGPDDRMFTVTKSYLHREMDRGAKEAGVPRIRIHDLRHTFATLSLESGMDVKTLSAMLGHVSAATTLDIYTHVTGDMQSEAAAKIDRGLGNEVRAESVQAEQNPTADFQPVLRKTRKPGTGCISQINDHLFEGRYSPTWPDGTKHSKCVYAHTREECEAKLKVLIQQMNTERQALRDHARGITPPDKLTKTQKKIWMYMKFHPDVTSYRAIARGAGVTRHTAAKWYEMMREMLGRTA